MLVMVVTLDVSKLSGWLNLAYCRVERGDVCVGEARTGGGGRRRREQHAGGRLSDRSIGPPEVGGVRRL